MKTPVDTERPFELIIPDSYTPFEEVSCDLKTMYASKSGFKYLMVLVCNITRFVILVPLKSKDATTVAEAIVQKCVLTFGPFKRFISDQGTEFCNQVVEYVFKSLKVKHSFVAVQQHRGNKSERFVGTMSKLLTSCLVDTGDNWPVFCNAVAYSYNSFSISSLGNYSPYYLVFLRHPPTTFDCNPTLHISSTYRDYVDLLKARLEKVGQVVLDLQAYKQQEQARRQNQKVKNPPTFSEGILVFLLSPTTSALQTKSKKIRLDYVGPLVISNMLDRSHAVLSTLDGKQLNGIFHVCRLKVAWIRTESGNTNKFSELSNKIIARELNHPSSHQGGEFHMIRGRYYNGNMEVLVSMNDPTCQHHQWINLRSCENYSQLCSIIADNNYLRVSGSVQALVRNLCA
jgi:hypothetical protein